ncbi:MAG: DNA polymerase III, subunit gamma and tau [Candidatus Cloacimonetes bacterium 4572_55]|nr:MAG: DNA polymerase III, subunit gamma and tau [Candidatus Cloacimonetes bacterium 4572_55]
MRSNPVESTMHICLPAQEASAKPHLQESCKHCTRVTAGNHIDVFEIDGASNRGIDEIRNLREQVKYTPSSARYKIYIIDEVHMLTNEAFNALLKTLEEPPSHVVFIFATTEVHKIPATILSRCQKFDFRRISLEEIQHRLKKISLAENAEIDDQAIYLIAQKADGSLRDGESLLDQILSFSVGRVTEKEARKILGAVDQEIYFRITDAILSQDIESGLKIVDAIFSQGYDLHEFSMGFIEHLRNLLIIKNIKKQANSLGIPDNYLTQYKKIGRYFESTDVLRLLNIALKMEAESRKNVHSRSQFELRLIAMINLESTVALSDILKFLNGYQALPASDATSRHPDKNASQVKESPVDGPSVDSSSDKSDSEEIKDLLIKKLSQKNKHLSLPFYRSDLIREGNQFSLCLDAEQDETYYYQEISDPVNRQHIKLVLSEIVGKKVEFTCYLNSPEKKKILSSQPIFLKEDPTPYQLLSEQLTRRNPGLKSVVELFNGKFVT